MDISPQEHKLLKVKIKDLKFDDSNPNQLTEEQMEGLRKSMKKFGYLTPIVIDQNNMIADGEHRALIYKEFGHQEIPCFKVNLESDIDRRMLRQVMNKLHGEHGIQKDADELLRVFEANKLDELAQLIAKPKEELQEQLTKYRGVQFQEEEKFDVDDEYGISKGLTSETKLLDIWQLGNHRIICADSSDQRSLDILMEGKKADMIFTDPPYNIMGSSTGFTKMEDDNMIKPFFRETFKTIKQNLKLDGHCYICCNWRSFPIMYYQNKEVGIIPKNLIVWHKPNARLGSMYSSSHEFIFFLANDYRDKYLTVNRGKVKTVYAETNVWVQNITTNKERDHHADKPVPLMTRAIKNSTDKNEIVLDLFLGGGSTLIACEQTGRKCFGVEIDPAYVDVTIKRWEAFTGKKAKLLTKSEIMTD